MLKKLFYSFICMIQDMWNNNDYNTDLGDIIGSRILACAFVAIVVSILLFIGMLTIIICSHVKVLMFIVIVVGLFSLLMKFILSIKPPTTRKCKSPNDIAKTSKKPKKTT